MGQCILLACAVAGQDVQPLWAWQLNTCAAVVLTYDIGEVLAWRDDCLHRCDNLAGMRVQPAVKAARVRQVPGCAVAEKV